MKLKINVKHNSNPKLRPIIHHALWHAARNPAWEVEFLEREDQPEHAEDIAYEKN